VELRRSSGGARGGAEAGAPLAASAAAALAVGAAAVPRETPRTRRWRRRGGDEAVSDEWAGRATVRGADCCWDPSDDQSHEGAGGALRSCLTASEQTGRKGSASHPVLRKVLAAARGRALAPSGPPLRHGLPRPGRGLQHRPGRAAGQRGVERRRGRRGRGALGRPAPREARREHLQAGCGFSSRRWNKQPVEDKRACELVDSCFSVEIHTAMLASASRGSSAKRQESLQSCCIL